MTLQEILKMQFSVPTLVVPIGPSGAGKSTLYKALKEAHPTLDTFSLDALRHEWYDPVDYARAFQLSTEDRGFQTKANARFQTMIEKKQHLFIDNTNLTPKRRKFYLDLAHKYGYNTIALILNTPLETLIERQTTRGDKNVPEAAVRQQYSSMVLPGKGEFDRVVMVHNEAKSNKG